MPKGMKGFQKGNTFGNRFRGLRGDNNHNWKGGRRVSSYGYILVLMPTHHRADSRGYVLEHILIMEKMPGRPDMVK
jgi:hypothetical protein